MIILLIVSVGILITAGYYFEPKEFSRKNLVIGMIIGVAVTISGIVIQTLVAEKIREKSEREKLTEHLLMTKDRYSNFRQHKNFGAFASNLSLAVKDQGLSLLDSVEYTYLAIPDYYEKLISDETLYKFLTDEFRCYVPQFQEKNQIDKLKFERIQDIREKQDLILKISLEFDEQIGALEDEIKYQQGELSLEELTALRKKKLLESLK